VADARFEEHLRHPCGHGERPSGAFDGAAGGAPCGDLIRVSVAVDDDGAISAGFDAEGCGALIAAGSALCALVAGAGVLDGARIGAEEVAAELGGLSPGKLHAAELAADAFHSALGKAVAVMAPLPAVADRTLVAMSGGVDSSVVAVLAGPQAVGVTVELWRDAENDGERSCCSAAAVRSARACAHRLGLPHLTLDLRTAFRAKVVEPWLAAHAAGETPNPCVACNGNVRLDAMAALAERIGAQALATGHYARIGPGGLLRAAADGRKDQSYMLAGLAPATIARLRFPLGTMTKGQVRELAREHGLAAAGAPDSQDLCFLAGSSRARFLERHGAVGPRPGAIVDESGAVVGRHDGHTGFTVGQRRGIGAHGGEPRYVLATDAKANTVTIGPREALLTDRVALRGLRLHRSPDAVDHVRLRYHAPAVPCRLDGDTVRLEHEFAAPAPGQTAVLLSGDVVVGSATIARP